MSDTGSPPDASQSPPLRVDGSVVRARQLIKRGVGITVLTIVVVIVVLVLQPLAVAIAWAAFLAFLLHPWQLRLTHLLHSGSRAAAVLTLLTPLALLIPIVLIGISFAEQVTALVGNVQENSESLSPQSWRDSSAHPQIANALDWMEKNLSVSVSQLQGWLTTAAQNGLRLMAAVSGKLFINAAGMFVQFFLMLFILFFTLRDGRTWFRRAVPFLPMQPRRREQLIDRLQRVIRAVVYGSGLTGLVQGTLVGIGFAVMGLAAPVVFAVLAVLASFIPTGGAALVWGPAVLYLAIVGRLGAAAAMLGWGIVISVSDNFIRPIIVTRYTPVPALLVFLGVIGGIPAFGLLGIVVGPVILVLATELFQYAEQTLRRRAPG